MHHWEMQKTPAEAYGNEEADRLGEAHPWPGHVRSGHRRQAARVPNLTVNAATAPE